MAKPKFTESLIRFIIILSLILGGIVFFIKNPVFDTKLKVTHLPEVQIELLKQEIQFLSQIQPPRNIKNVDSLNRVAQHIFDQLKSYGYEPQFQEFQARGNTYKNVIAVFNPNRFPPIVMGAHYDVAHDFPGADDNASGTAVLLELARTLKEHHKTQKKMKNSVELVFYTLEEPPAFRTEDMGSYHHALSLAKANRDIRLMISIETVGYYSDEEGTQKYPLSALEWLFPTKGNFLAVAGETSHWMITRKVKSLFKLTSSLAIESLNAPASIAGIDFSDHLNYWKFGYPALMVTDTAFYRNQNYHKATDTIDTLDFKRLKQVVEGLLGVCINF